MAIILLFASTATIAIRTVFQADELRSSASQVRTLLHKTRNRAMTTGRICLFRLQHDSPAYRIEYFQAEEETYSGETPVDTDPILADTTDLVDENGVPKKNIVHGGFTIQFPKGVIFYQGGTGYSNREQNQELFLEDLGSDWSTPIFFYPDGSCSDASLVLVNEEEKAIQLTVRGLTGTVELGKLVPLSKIQELEQSYLGGTGLLGN